MLVDHHDRAGPELLGYENRGQADGPGTLDDNTVWNRGEREPVEALQNRWQGTAQCDDRFGEVASGMR